MRLRTASTIDRSVSRATNSGIRRTVRSGGKVLTNEIRLRERICSQTISLVFSGLSPEKNPARSLLGSPKQNTCRCFAKAARKLPAGLISEGKNVLTSNISLVTIHQKRVVCFWLKVNCYRLIVNPIYLLKSVCFLNTDTVSVFRKRLDASQ